MEMRDSPSLSSFHKLQSQETWLKMGLLTTRTSICKSIQRQPLTPLITRNVSGSKSSKRLNLRRCVIGNRRIRKAFRRTLTSKRSKNETKRSSPWLRRTTLRSLKSTLIDFLSCPLGSQSTSSLSWFIWSPLRFRHPSYSIIFLLWSFLLIREWWWWTTPPPIQHHSPLWSRTYSSGCTRSKWSLKFWGKDSSSGKEHIERLSNSLDAW